MHALLQRNEASGGAPMSLVAWFRHQVSLERTVRKTILGFPDSKFSVSDSYISLYAVSARPSRSLGSSWSGPLLTFM